MDLFNIILIFIVSLSILQTIFSIIAAIILKENGYKIKYFSIDPFSLCWDLKELSKIIKEVTPLYVILKILTSILLGAIGIILLVFFWFLLFK